MTNDFLNTIDQSIVAVIDGMKPVLCEAYGSGTFTTKKDNTIVTLLDIQLEEKIREALLTLDGGIGIIGEEYGAEGDKDTYWLVDPIDGTEQFARGISSCKTQVCLVENGQVVWSMLNYFMRGDVLLARRGQGATLNGQKVQVTERPLNRAWLDMSVDMSDESILPKLAELRRQLAGLTVMHDTSLIIQGKTDGTLTLAGGGGPWDYAPRSLFYEEAGATITNIDSDTYDFTNTSFLVAHPANFEKIMSIIA